MTKLMKTAGLMGLIALLAACGTIDGIGQDISGASRTVRGWF